MSSTPSGRPGLDGAGLEGAGLEGAGLAVTWLAGSRAESSAEELLALEVGRICQVGSDEVTVGRLCRWCGSSEHGKPYLRGFGASPPPQVSLSRTGALVMVAVGHGGPVGVDVESVHRFDLPGLRAVVLHDSEEATDAADLARIWVRKEALLKATGEGLRVDPRSVRVSSPREPAALLEWGAESRARPLLHDVPVDQGHVAAVAVLGPAPLRLTTRRAAPGELAH